METERNSTPPNDAASNDAVDMEPELPCSDIQLVAAENTVQGTEERAGDDQVGFLNPNRSLEIVVDGSGLLNGAVGSDGLEISIKFEKNDEEDGYQNELVNRLDGFEVRVSVDNTQTIGVELVSTSHGDEETLEHGDVQLALEGAGREAWSPDTEPHTVPELNFLPAPDDVAENSNAGDESLTADKKRPREGQDGTGRFLKPKTISDETRTDDLSRTSMQIGECKETVKLVAEELVIAGSPSVDSAKDLSGMELEGNGMDSRNLCQKETASAAEDLGLYGTVCKRKEADGGHGAEDNLCIKGSAEIADDHGIDDSVCDKDTTLDDGAPRPRPLKRRKIAMLLAYCGAGYQGMQKNPGAVTIEGELEEALAKAGALPDNFDGNPRKVDWMRAARTDKGVSAVGQVVSGLFYVDPPGFVERVNTHLPKQIRLLGYKRVTPSFSAKKFCDRRRYEYVIPIFALDSNTHRDRESVLASEGKEGAFAKCLECSERGRKVPGAVGKGCDNSMPGEVGSVTTDNFDGPSPVLESTSMHEVANDEAAPSMADALELLPGDGMPLESKLPLKVEERYHASLQGQQIIELGSLNDLPEGGKGSNFYFGEAERTKLNRILSHYVGTHNFHNFTSRVKAEDPSAKRYIVSFEAGDVFTVGNTEFVKCTVVGQSFMLHQIRKMIGLAIAVFRGCAPESMLDRALRRDVHVTIPTAPELGLFLDECMYPAYNQKWYNSHEEVSQKGYEKEISCFKHDVIYEHIAATEYKEGQMALFLHSLNDRNYADFVTAREAEKLLTK